jgi:hypothetical protein
LSIDSRLQRLETDSHDHQRKLDGIDIADVNKRLYDIGVSVAGIEGKLNSQKKALHPVAITGLSVVGTLLVLFWGWMAHTVVDHGNTLASIRQSLLGLGITIAANNPTNPKAQEQARATLADAKRTSIRISGPVIEQAGKSFIAASKDDATAWDVSLQFADYRSVLNAGSIPNVGPQRDAQSDIEYSAFPRDVLFRPTVKSAGNTTPEQAARFEPITPFPKIPPTKHSENNSAQYLFIDFHNITISLDGMRLKNVVVTNATLKYTGGPIDLQNVLFVNCTFQITDEDQGRMLAEAILGNPNVNYKVS